MRRVGLPERLEAGLALVLVQRAQDARALRARLAEDGAGDGVAQQQQELVLALMLFVVDVLVVVSYVT